MPRLPHHRLETGFLQITGKNVGALDVEYDGVPIAQPLHQISTEEREQLVSVNDLSTLIHDADSVSIAVERNTQRGFHTTHGLLQIGEIFQYRGIGMVIGKRAVRFAEQRRDISAKSGQDPFRNETRHAVAAVHDDAKGPSQRTVAFQDCSRIPLEYGGFDLEAPGAVVGRIILNQPPQSLNVLTV